MIAVILKVAVVHVHPVHDNHVATEYLSPGDTTDTVRITPAFTVSTLTVPKLAHDWVIVRTSPTVYHVHPVATVTVFMNHHSIAVFVSCVHDPEAVLRTYGNPTPVKHIINFPKVTNSTG